MLDPLSEALIRGIRKKEPIKEEAEVITESSIKVVRSTSGGHFLHDTEKDRVYAHDSNAWIPRKGMTMSSDWSGVLHKDKDELVKKHMENAKKKLTETVKLQDVTEQHVVLDHLAKHKPGDDLRNLNNEPIPGGKVLSHSTYAIKTKHGVEVHSTNPISGETVRHTLSHDEMHHLIKHYTS